MKRQQIKNIVLHTVSVSVYDSASTKMTAFHVNVIERKLLQSGLSIPQKLKVIDSIIHNLKSREINSFIK